MICDFTFPVYAPNKNGGCNLAASAEDGYTIRLTWDRAFPSTLNYNVAYNIYYSTIREDVFTEGVKFVSILDGYTSACILDLSPGDTFYFMVKATEHDPSWMNLALLPNGFPDLKVYPEAVLLNNISAAATLVPISDIGEFPGFGVVQVGTELISYSSKDVPNNNLIVSERGFLGTNIRFHNTDGYDGYALQDPIVRFWKGFEDPNERVQQETSTFSFPNPAFTTADGYATKNDIITTNLSSVDSSMSDFPRYDYVGWHRTDPRRLLRGECIGTYYGGEQFCADGYGGVGRQLRGVSIQDQAARREEVLLETWGESCVLIRRTWSGKRCACVYSTTEHPEYRCVECYGTGFVQGFQQFFNSRRSDGRILVRFGPTEEDFRLDPSGLENVFIPDCWTIVFPSIKDRDIIVRFNEDGTEEFRYEILNVTRNKLLTGTSGAQKFKAQRLRKTEPVYMVRYIGSTATMPKTLTTSIGLIAEVGGTFQPHTHELVINEGIVSLSQINQITSVSASHSHSVIDGVIQEAFGHSHSIVLP